MSSLLRKKTTITSRRNELFQRLQFLGQMSSTETAHFHQIAASKNGTSITDIKTISVLLQEGSMTAGKLAKRLSLTTGAVTSVIDRLEAGGYVHRAVDSRDRRKVIVNINRPKIERQGDTYASMGKAFQALLEHYTNEQLEFLVKFYQDTIELTKLETQKLTKAY